MAVFDTIEIPHYLYIKFYPNIVDLSICQNGDQKDLRTIKRVTNYIKCSINYGTKCDRDKPIFLQKEGVNQIECRHNISTIFVTSSPKKLTYVKWL